MRKSILPADLPANLSTNRHVFCCSCTEDSPAYCSRKLWTRPKLEGSYHPKRKWCVSHTVHYSKKLLTGLRKSAKFSKNGWISAYGRTGQEILLVYYGMASEKGFFRFFPTWESLQDVLVADVLVATAERLVWLKCEVLDKKFTENKSQKVSQYLWMLCNLHLGWHEFST